MKASQAFILFPRWGEGNRSRLSFSGHEEFRHYIPRSSIIAGIYAGLRIEAEALTLKWDNVDLNRRLITIEAIYSKNRETQTVPIHSKLLAVLQQLWKTRKSEYVFSKPDGKALRSVRTAFTRACQRAKLSGVTPHTLRHT